MPQWPSAGGARRTRSLTYSPVRKPSRKACSSASWAPYLASAAGSSAPQAARMSPSHPGSSSSSLA